MSARRWPCIRWVGAAVGLSVCLGTGQAARGEDPCIDDLILDCGYVPYTFPENENGCISQFGFHDDPECTPAGEGCAALGSRCWGNFQDGANLTGWFYPQSPYQYLGGSGYPLNLSLHTLQAAVEFPPAHLDQAMSSSPLLAGEARHFRGPTPYRERPTHADAFDLITGKALVQAVDFELPFGSAAFRHVRTFTEYPFAGGIVGLGDDGLTQSTWDWNGRRWAMSENPILLIDAEYTGYPSDGHKTCYFIPDAHHAVPFIYDDNLDPPAYVPPPWFDAVLGHNGTPGENGTWEERPTEFYVWTHRKSVKYTFEPVWDLYTAPEAAGDNCTSAHDPPSVGGAGIPHLALLRQLSDRYGNRVEFEYCAPEAGEWTVCDNDVTDECVECCQSCNAIGQLQTARLYASGGTDPIWTIVYTYREFMLDHDPMTERYHFLLDRALHSIHVYEGAVAGLDPNTCRTISATTFCDTEDLAGMDSITGPALPDGDWRIEVRYLYSEHDYGVVRSAISISIRNSRVPTRTPIRSTSTRTTCRRAIEISTAERFRARSPISSTAFTTLTGTY